jgi:hypothetical protein
LVALQIIIKTPPTHRRTNMTANDNGNIANIDTMCGFLRLLAGLQAAASQARSVPAGEETPRALLRMMTGEPYPPFR